MAAAPVEACFVNTFEPQLPSWLRADVPLRIDRDVIPLICGLDYLPENWTRRKHLAEPSVNSIRIPVKGAPPFPPPHWTGDAPPTGVWVNQTINIPTFPETSDFDQNILSNNPPKEFWIYLVRDLGFPIDAALTSFGTSPGIQTPDRRRNGGHPTADGQESGRRASARFAQPAHPYNPAAPNRRTEVGGGFSRDQVLKSLATMRTDDNTRMACFEVVYRRRPPKEIAKKFGIKWANLKVYATRVRQRIRGTSNKVNTNAGFHEEVLTPCA